MRARYKTRKGQTIDIRYDSYELQEGDRWVSSKDELGRLHRYVIGEDGTVKTGYYKNTNVSSMESYQIGDEVILSDGRKAKKVGNNRWKVGMQWLPDIYIAKHMGEQPPVKPPVEVEPPPAKKPSKPKVEPKKTPKKTTLKEIQEQIDNCSSIGEINKLTTDYLKKIGQKTTVDLAGAELDVAKESAKKIAEIASEYTMALSTIKMAALGYGTGGEYHHYGSKILYSKSEVGKKHWYWGRTDRAINFNEIGDDEQKRYLTVVVHELAHAICNSVHLNNAVTYSKHKELIEQVEKVKEKYLENFPKSERSVMQHLDFKFNKLYKTMTIGEKQQYAKLQEKYQNEFISEYALTNTAEFIAECFTNAKMRKKPSSYALEVLKIMEAYKR